MNAQPVLLTGALHLFDHDCACPDKGFGLAFEPGAHEIGGNLSASALSFVPTPNTHVQSLPGEHYLVYSPLAPAGPSVINRPAWERWQQFHYPQPLEQPIDFQLAEQALVQPVGSRVRPHRQPPETLTAWLHVTNACNLDCPYCYVRKSSARMTEAIGLQAVAHICDSAARHAFRRVKLKYAGGESTLHFKLIRRLHEAAVEQATTQELELREVILSNGVHIRPADADWLVDNHVKLMVSLDGVGAIHDQQRPMRGGGGSFHYVQRTLDEILLPRGIHPDITLTVTRLNAAGAAATVEWALQRNLPISLNFYRQNSLTVDRQELRLEEEAIINGLLAAYQVFESFLPTESFLNGLLDRVQMEAHAHTCGVEHSYVVITHKGQVAQCQMHLEQPVGLLGEGDLLPMLHQGRIRNVAVDEKEGCRDCEFRYRCAGGCPLETYRATGRWDIKSPHCRIYKTLLPQALRLEGLRLLKVHQLSPLAS